MKGGVVGLVEGMVGEEEMGGGLAGTTGDGLAGTMGAGGRIGGGVGRTEGGGKDGGGMTVGGGRFGDGGGRAVGGGLTVGGGRFGGGGGRTVGGGRIGGGLAVVGDGGGTLGVAIGVLLPCGGAVGGEPEPGVGGFAGVPLFVFTVEQTFLISPALPTFTPVDVILIIDAVKLWKN